MGFRVDHLDHGGKPQVQAISAVRSNLDQGLDRHRAVSAVHNSLDQTEPQIRRSTVVVQVVQVELHLSLNIKARQSAASANQKGNP